MSTNEAEMEAVAAGYRSASDKLHFQFLIVGMAAVTAALPVLAGYFLLTVGQVGKVGTGKPWLAFNASEWWAYWTPYFLLAAMVIMTVNIFAGAATRVMSKYRCGNYQCRLMQARQATLWQRSLAKSVDGLLLLLPIVLAGYVLFAPLGWNGVDSLTKLGNGTEAVGNDFLDRPFLRLLEFMAIGVMVPFASSMIFSIVEGRGGRTVGKWLMGIEVRNNSLDPCGFGPAFVRRVLFLVDGLGLFLLFGLLGAFFVAIYRLQIMVVGTPEFLLPGLLALSLMVGLVLIALTENCQRLGDLAARTVVVQSTSLRPADDLDEPDAT